MEVVSINGSYLDEIIKEKIKEIGGGTIDFKTLEALRKIQSSEESSSVFIEAKDEEGSPHSFTLNFVGGKNFPEKTAKDFVEGKLLNENVGYLKIKTWSNNARIGDKNIADLINDEMAKLGNLFESLIIDVRQNGGGNSSLAAELAGRFTSLPKKFCTIKRKVEMSEELAEQELYLQPAGEFLDKKIVVMTGSRCLSSNEMFVLMMKDVCGATILGQTTGGGSGAPKFFDLDIGNDAYTLSVSTWKMFKNDGLPLECNGIDPDIPVKISPKDVIKNRDVELENALEYLIKS